MEKINLSAAALYIFNVYSKSVADKFFPQEV
jgi:hypothetical protein